MQICRTRLRRLGAHFLIPRPPCFWFRLGLGPIKIKERPAQPSGWCGTGKYCNGAWTKGPYKPRAGTLWGQGRHAMKRSCVHKPSSWGAYAIKVSRRTSLVSVSLLTDSMSCTDQIWRLTLFNVTIQIIPLKSKFMTHVLLPIRTRLLLKPPGTYSLMGDVNSALKDFKSKTSVR